MCSGGNRAARAARSTPARVLHPPPHWPPGEEGPYAVTSRHWPHARPRRPPAGTVTPYTRAEKFESFERLNTRTGGGQKMPSPKVFRE